MIHSVIYLNHNFEDLVRNAIYYYHDIFNKIFPPVIWLV